MEHFNKNFNEAGDNILASGSTVAKAAAATALMGAVVAAVGVNKTAKWLKSQPSDTIVGKFNQMSLSEFSKWAYSSFYEWTTMDETTVETLTKDELAQVKTSQKEQTHAKRREEVGLTK